MTRLRLAAAVLLAAIAAWLSQATLALATPDGPLIALVPTSWLALVVPAVAALAVIGVARAGLSLAPVWLLTFLLLPWLPLPVPAAFLMWSGAIRSLIWVAVVLLVLAQLGPRFARILDGVRLLGSRPRLCAGALAFAVFAWSAWQVSPSVPGGDEPHYLVITQSLLLDRDLKIENNHTRGDYQAYYAGLLRPHYIQRGRDGEIYSIHAPGLSALAAPAFALAGYRGVVFFLLVLSACGSALAWHLAWLATRKPSAAWFGWAAVTFSATAIFHSFAVYPDGLAGAIVLTGVWALFRAMEERAAGAVSDVRLRPWFLHGAALALLPWLHSRFALLAGSLGALVLLRLASTRNPAGKAVAFLSVPAVSAICWIGSFVLIYGTPDPSAPYGATSDVSIAFIPGGLSGILFDQRFGLLANAPVLLFAFVGLVLMMRLRRASDAPPSAGLADRRLAFELLFVLVPYLLTATSYAMWWAGSSAPARFANPAVPMFAIPCAAAWAMLRGRVARVTAAGSLALTIWLSFVLVSTDGGRLAYNTRETTALWLDWASRLVALGEGMPVWYRGRDAAFALDVTTWALALLLAYALARSLASRAALRHRTPYLTAVAALFALSGMLALTIVWAIRGVDGVIAAPAQLDLLRRLGTERRSLALQVAPPRVLGREAVLEMIRIESTPRVAGRGGTSRTDLPLATFPTVPAGRYRLVARTRGPGGWLLLGVGQDQFTLRSAPMSFPPAPIEIQLPVDVRALVVRGDEEARQAVRSVIVVPIEIVPADAKLTDRVARRAVKYDGASVFFLDDGSFPEPEAFWMGGARQGSVVVQPDVRTSSIPVLLRNAPIDNQVTLASGQWREELALAPGEERRLQIPLLPGRDAALVSVTTRAGFRPSESVPGSRDARVLGVWIKVGG